MNGRFHAAAAALLCIMGSKHALAHVIARQEVCLGSLAGKLLNRGLEALLPAAKKQQQHAPKADGIKTTFPRRRPTLRPERASAYVILKPEHTSQYSRKLSRF
jgi:hypothetical protein